MKLEEKIELIRRVDQLIKRKATGNPHELASRLNMSKSSLYRLIGFMKTLLEAPIQYCTSRESYYYEYEVDLVIGFLPVSENIIDIKGGFCENKFQLNSNSQNMRVFDSIFDLNWKVYSTY